MNQILMMSNDPILKRKNLDVLVDAGFRVTDVSDALDGLLMVDKDGFSAIIIDEELADIDGYRACQKIRQYSQIPIVLLGTESSEDVWSKADDLGFDVYLKKPVSPRELVAQIKSVLRRAHYEERPRPSQIEKPSGLYTPTQTIPPVRVGRAAEPEITLKAEKPSGTAATPVIPLQELPTARLGKTEQIEKPTQAEKPAEVPSASVMPLRETPLVRLDKTAEPESLAVQQEKPVELPATRMVTALEETKSITLTGITTPAPAKTEGGESSIGVWTDARMTKLVDALAAGKFTEINPEIDVSAPSGFAYPEVDRLIGAIGDETRLLLESLAKENVLKKNPFEKVYADPDGSFQLVPVERCPSCGCGSLTRGQLVEHFSCGNVGMEQDYSKTNQKYICPKCQKELKLLGNDYRNVGVRYKCGECSELFPTPVIKWRNLKSGKTWSFEELQEIQLFSYVLSPDKKDWLEFQLKPKAQLVDFLRLKGYQVEEMARVQGGSGAVHTIDILATRDDELAKYHLGVGILIASRGRGEISLEELFEFDTKAYDMGLNYKVVIVIPKLSREATKFAERQKIGVFEAKEPSSLISFLSSQKRSSASVLTGATSHYLDQLSTSSGTKGQIAAFLRSRGYDVYDRATILGKSGTEHTFSLFAQRDDVIVKPAIAVDVVTDDNGQVVGIDKLQQFDAEAFDAGIRNKVFVGIPKISTEAKQFAKQQRIKALDEYELLGLIRSYTLGYRLVS